MEVAVYSQDPRPNIKGYKHPKGAPGKQFHPFARAWRGAVAHAQRGRSRRLSRSFENTTNSSTAWLELACIRASLAPWSDRSLALAGSQASAAPLLTVVV